MPNIKINKVVKCEVLLLILPTLECHLGIEETFLSMKPKPRRKKRNRYFEYIKNRGEIVSTFFKKDCANDNIRQIKGGFPNTERSNTDEYVKDNQLISRRPEQSAHRRGKCEWLINIKRCSTEKQIKMQYQAKAIMKIWMTYTAKYQAVRIKII